MIDLMTCSLFAESYKVSVVQLFDFDSINLI